MDPSFACLPGTHLGMAGAASQVMETLQTSSLQDRACGCISYSPYDSSLISSLLPTLPSSAGASSPKTLHQMLPASTCGYRVPQSSPSVLSDHCSHWPASINNCQLISTCAIAVVYSNFASNVIISHRQLQPTVSTERAQPGEPKGAD